MRLNTAVNKSDLQKLLGIFMAQKVKLPEVAVKNAIYFLNN